jgi:NADH-ubiquinone oxidoreductase chain 6
MITTIVNLLTFGILFSSIISITSNNPIISIIFLITAFVNAAGYLILLGINFIGISYIVIYVGAIAVLFLFIILMINIKLTDILDTGYNFTKNLPIGLNIASLVFFIFFSVAANPISKGVSDPLSLFLKGGGSNLFPFSPNATIEIGKEEQFSTKANDSLSRLTPDGDIIREGLAHLSEAREGGAVSDVNLLEFTQIEVLGHFLYTYASIFLIILSLILLLAMLAIIIISKKNITNI